jgi:hypothetical protein
VEVVTADDVTAAAADESDRKAAESEQGAVTGTVGHDQAVSDRAAAMFARQRHRLAAAKHGRHLQAERIRALAVVAADAQAHAASLGELRSKVMAHIATIDAEAAKAQSEVRQWNSQLSKLIAQAAALNPEKPRPGMAPSPSSANCYAATSAPVFITGATILRPVAVDDAKEIHDLPGVVDKAVTATREHPASERLVIFPNGLVQPLGKDAGGHIQRRIERGEARELSLAERRAFYDGQQVSSK